MVDDFQPIFVDDRAGSNRLLRYPSIRALCQETRLDGADVALIGNGPDGPLMVGVEVKSIFDLISSMNTGRLQGTQVPALMKYDERWLLYYGSYRPGRGGTLEVYRKGTWRRHRIGNRDVPYGYVESFLLNLVVTGINVKHAFNEEEAVEWIACLHRWWSKPWTKHKGLRTLDRSKQSSLLPSMDAETKLRVKVASQLPGVGFERALAAAQYFPTVEAMINARVEEWAAIPGIGRVIAKAIRQAIVT